MNVRQGLARHVGALLVLAALLSLMIAFGCALFAPLTQGTRFVTVTPSEIEWSVRHGQYGFPASFSGQWVGFGISERRYFLDDRPYSRFDDPFDGGLNGFPDEQVQRVLEYVRHRPVAFAAARVEAGWPFRCLYGEQWMTPPVPAIPEKRHVVVATGRVINPPPLIGPATPSGMWPTRYRFAVGRISSLDGTRGTPARTIPLLPLPLGLVLNILFYATVMFAVWEFLRRSIRLRRLAIGRCPRCGYPQRTNSIQCPECGEGVMIHIDR